MRKAPFYPSVKKERTHTDTPCARGAGCGGGALGGGGIAGAGGERGVQGGGSQ